MTFPNSPIQEFEIVHCPVCGPTDFLIWQTSDSPARYLRCRACRTVYASPRSIYQKRNAWLDRCFGVGESAINNSQSRLPVLALEAAKIQSIASQGCVLDVGCDLGHFLGFFDLNHWERFGVELVPSAAAFAEREFHAKVFAGTIHDAKFPTHQFDLVTLIDVIFYLDNPRADLLEIRRVLGPEGLFVIETSGQFYQLSRSRGLACFLIEGKWNRIDPAGAYILWLSPKGLEKILEQSGFRVTGYEPVPGAPQNHWALRVIEKKYFQVIKFLIFWFPSLLTLAPKFLMYAQPRGTGSEVIVRRAGRYDIPEIAALHSRYIRNSCFTSIQESQFLEHYYSETIRHKHCFLNVAECKGEIIGYSLIASAHKNILISLVLRHPISALKYLISTMASNQLVDIFFSRVSRELLMTKFKEIRPPREGFCELRSIAVVPEYRAKGPARRLLAASLACAQKSGLNLCFSWVSASNLESLGLFKNAGFIIRNTQSEHGQDVHILEWNGILDVTKRS